MVDADLGRLRQLVDHDFALIHITGYEQPRNEWFEVIRTRQFAYHRIEVDPDSMAIRLDGNIASVTGNGVFNATIHGTRNPWRLQFELQLAERAGRWMIMRAQYASY